MPSVKGDFGAHYTITIVRSLQNCKYEGPYSIGRRVQFRLEGLACQGLWFEAVRLGSGIWVWRGGGVELWDLRSRA